MCEQNLGEIFFPRNGDGSFTLCSRTLHTSMTSNYEPRYVIVGSKFCPVGIWRRLGLHYVVKKSIEQQQNGISGQSVNNFRIKLST